MKLSAFKDLDLVRSSYISSNLALCDISQLFPQLISFCFIVNQCIFQKEQKNIPNKSHLFNPNEEKGKGTTLPLSSDLAFTVFLFTPHLHAEIMV